MTLPESKQFYQKKQHMLFYYKKLIWLLCPASQALLTDAAAASQWDSSYISTLKMISRRLFLSCIDTNHEEWSSVTPLLFHPPCLSLHQPGRFLYTRCYWSGSLAWFSEELPFKAKIYNKYRWTFAGFMSIMKIWDVLVQNIPFEKNSPSF